MFSVPGSGLAGCLGFGALPFIYGDARVSADLPDGGKVSELHHRRLAPPDTVGNRRSRSPLPTGSTPRLAHATFHRR
jgi:hypothetical protein